MSSSNAAVTLMPLQALVKTKESGLPLVKEMLSEQLCEMIPVARREDGERELVALQVTTRSPMGAIAHAFAAIFIQHGFIRLFGAGRHPRIDRSVTSASAGKFPAFEMESSSAGSTKIVRPGGLVIADDVLGGVFALSGGNVPGVALGHVGYYSPATQQFEDLGFGYSDFVAAMGSKENFLSFYADALWPGWEGEVSALHGDQVLSFYPPLMVKVEDDSQQPTATAEGDDDGAGGRPDLKIGKRSRKPISVAEVDQKWT